MKLHDLSQIQKTKRPLLQKTLQSLRIIVWIIAIIFAIVLIIIGRNSNYYIIASIITIVAVVFHIIIKYIDTSLMTWDLWISLSIAYFLAFCCFVLVPLDTAQAIKQQNELNEKNLILSEAPYNETFLKWWQAIYWTMMGTNMIFMNLQNLFHKTGHLFFSSRIKATLKAYLKLLFIFAIPYVIGCILIFIFTKQIKIGVMTQVFLLLSNIYGITVLTLLIGYGLVQFPYQLWLKTNRNRTLDLLLTKAGSLYNRYAEAKEQLNALKMKTLIDQMFDGHSLAIFKKKLIESLPNQENDFASPPSYVNSQDIKKIPMEVVKTKFQQKITKIPLKYQITEDIIAEARFQLKQSSYNLSKLSNKWNNHCDKVFRIVEIASLEVKQNKVEIDKRDFFNSQYKQLKVIQMNKRLVFVYRFFAVLLGILSLLVLFCEAALIFSQQNNSALFFCKIIENSNNIAGTTFFILIILGYILFCSCFALFEIDLGAGFEIYPYHTHPLTLMFNSKTCGTIAIPLCYNVMLIFQQVNNNNTQFKSGFDTFYKPVSTVPFLGSWYNLVVCSLISVVGFLSLFSSIKKLVTKVSRNKIDMGNDDIEIESIKSGEKLVIYEWTKRKRQQSIKNLSQRGIQKQDSSIWINVEGVAQAERNEQDNNKITQDLKDISSRQTLEKKSNNNNINEDEEDEMVSHFKQLQQTIKEMSIEDIVNSQYRNKKSEINSSNLNHQNCISFQEKKNQTLEQDQKLAKQRVSEKNQKMNQNKQIISDNIVMEQSESQESSPQKPFNYSKKKFKANESNFEITIHATNCNQQDSQKYQQQTKQFNHQENSQQIEVTAPIAEQDSSITSLQINSNDSDSQKEIKHLKKTEHSPRRQSTITSCKIIKTESINLESKISEIQEKQILEQRLRNQGSWIYKKNNNSIISSFKGWNKKYLVINKSELLYFSDKKQTNDGHAILLKDIVSVHLNPFKEEDKINKQFCFRITANQRKYDFKADTQDEASIWVDIIKLSLDN